MRGSYQVIRGLVGLEICLFELFFVYESLFVFLARAYFPPHLKRIPQTAMMMMIMMIMTTPMMMSHNFIFLHHIVFFN